MTSSLHAYANSDFSYCHRIITGICLWSTIEWSCNSAGRSSGNNKPNELNGCMTYVVYLTKGRPVVCKCRTTDNRRPWYHNQYKTQVVLNVLSYGFTFKQDPGSTLLRACFCKTIDYRYSSHTIKLTTFGGCLSLF